MQQINQQVIQQVNERHAYNTRNQNDLDIKFCGTRTTKKSIVYSGFKVFNQLPRALRKEDTVKKFKEGLRE